MYSLHGAPFGPLQCTVGAARTACPALTFFCRVYDVQRLQHNMCRVHHVKRYSVGFVSKGARRTVHSVYDIQRYTDANSSRSAHCRVNTTCSAQRVTCVSRIARTQSQTAHQQTATTHRPVRVAATSPGSVAECRGTAARLSCSAPQASAPCGGGAECLGDHTEPRGTTRDHACLLYTSPSPRDATLSRMPSSA